MPTEKPFERIYPATLIFLILVVTRYVFVTLYYRWCCEGKEIGSGRMVVCLRGVATKINCRLNRLVWRLFFQESIACSTHITCHRWKRTQQTHGHVRGCVRLADLQPKGGNSRLARTRSRRWLPLRRAGVCWTRRASNREHKKEFQLAMKNNASLVKITKGANIQKYLFFFLGGGGIILFFGTTTTSSNSIFPHGLGRIIILFPFIIGHDRFYNFQFIFGRSTNSSRRSSII